MICANPKCLKTFDRPLGSARITCCRSCAVALSWAKAPTERAASIRASKQTAEARAKTIETNHKRWARPGEREKLSERNRRMWANPAGRLLQSRAISKAWTPERRASMSELRTLEWATDAAYRTATVAGIRRSKGAPESRALFSRLLKERWQDPVWRERWRLGMMRRMAKPEERAKMAALLKARWADPEQAAKMLRGATKRCNLVATLREMHPSARRGFSMMAMRIRDPLVDLRLRQAAEASKGRLNPVMGTTLVPA